MINKAKYFFSVLRKDLRYKIVNYFQSRQKDNSKLDQKIIDAFCKTFGEIYRDKLTLSTSMDDVEEWDSLSFIDFVITLEQIYSIKFTNDEAAQMFQLGHIQRMINQAKLNIPYDDIANCFALSYMVKKEFKDEFKLVTLSTSSTREALLPAEEASKILEQNCQRKCGWYNISVSGLVLVEQLQLLEAMGYNWDGVVVIGISPVIFCGCGEAEFNRAAQYTRFPFRSRITEKILSKYDYHYKQDSNKMLYSLDIHGSRYLKNKENEQVKKSHYQYPTLKAWNNKKFLDEESLLLYYNKAVLNYRESMQINEEVLDAIADWKDKYHKEVLLFSLPLHSSVCSYFDKVDENIIKNYNKKINELVDKRKFKFVNIPQKAGIEDHDYRDPGHIFRKKEIFTETWIKEAISNNSINNDMRES